MTDRLTERLNIAIAALQKISDADYRGNRPWQAVEAFNALQAIDAVLAGDESPEIFPGTYDALDELTTITAAKSPYQIKTIRLEPMPMTVRTHPGETLEQVGPNEWKVVAALASRGEGEPRRWVAKHTDQHVVRPEPFERGMNFVVQSREAADRLAEILNAQPAPPDLVDAALELLHAADAQIYGPPSVEVHARYSLARIPIRRLEDESAALQNTPQPDESEAAKLERLMRDSDGELRITGTKNGWEIEQQSEDRMVCIGEGETLAAALSNTPEVDDDAE